jgi:pre-mRNA-processing factor 40
MEIMQGDRRTSSFDPDLLSLIYERIIDKVKKRSEDDKHQADRQQRHAVEDLRSKIKHLEPPVRPGDTWEQVRSRVEKTEEYRAVSTEELRRSAFDKVMRRLLDKEDDKQRERSRREHRDHRDRERDRDRRDRDRDLDRDHRDHRNGDGDGHRRHRTATPAEPDAYEAERKKAQADRERQHRDRTGLTPPPRRERDERDRYERNSLSRQVPTSHYDRERREREADRERTYVSRADPRDRSDELDYGDSRPSSVRRRRESDGGSTEGVRESKVRITFLKTIAFSGRSGLWHLAADTQGQRYS